MASGVSIVIPAFNEELAIANTIRAIRAALDGPYPDHEIVVVNDGSQDRTEEIALGEDDDQVLDLVRQLDRRQDQVLIETALVELTGTSLRDIGVELVDLQALVPRNTIPSEWPGVRRSPIRHRPAASRQPFHPNPRPARSSPAKSSTGL